MGTVYVSKLALRAASDQQVCDLWQGTSWRLSEEGSHRIIAVKSDGDVGLGKLLAFKYSISDM